MEETIQDLLIDLGLPETYNSKTLELLKIGEAKYLRDLRMNINACLTSENLSLKETSLLALAIASNNNNNVLVDVFVNKAKQNEANNEEIAEAISVASLLSANNVLYRFRHFVEKENYNTMRANIRMNIMARPVLGKEFFELISLAVSAVNGCEMCVKSHEKSVLEAGSTEGKVFDAIRIASVITSAGKIIN